ncbi:hypothetical protein NPIL_215641 [Nephila pilipes]|uniref:Uncharacterized protein n=1 Tax=Nephila pilipes TaxID=299642 RepID=A0A8X6NEM8_NEPPI|nr:hypothetical protein NPIL_215641 [Nephila pilipes]
MKAIVRCHPPKCQQRIGKTEKNSSISSSYSPDSPSRALTPFSAGRQRTNKTISTSALRRKERFWKKNGMRDLPISQTAWLAVSRSHEIPIMPDAMQSTKPNLKTKRGLPIN